MAAKETVNEFHYLCNKYLLDLFYFVPVIVAGIDNTKTHAKYFLP